MTNYVSLYYTFTFSVSFDALLVKAPNIGLLQNSENGTLASDTADWGDAPNGFYYYGANGASLGFPVDYCMVVHLRRGVVNFDLCIAQSGIVFSRRYNTSNNQSRAWVQV